MSLESKSYSHYSEDSKGFWSCVPGNRDKGQIYMFPMLSQFLCSNPAMVPHPLGVKARVAQWPTRSSMTQPRRISSPAIFPNLTLQPPPAAAHTQLTWPCLRAFAPALLSTWSKLPRCVSGCLPHHLGISAQASLCRNSSFLPGTPSLLLNVSPCCSPFLTL